MIRKVRDVGFKNIKHNKFIVISSIFSIMIALVIFLSMFNFIRNSEKTLMDNIHKVYGDMDISISYDRELNKDFTQETVNKIINNEGVEKSSEVLIDFLYVEGSDTYIAGLEDNDLSKSRYKYTSSLKDNSIVINTGLAQRLNKGIGDTVEIENDFFTIKEVLQNDKNNLDIPNILIMDINNLREFTGKIATGVMVKLNKDVVNTVNFATSIKEEIDKDIESEIVEENEVVKVNLQSLKIFIYILGALILIMSGYLILINFNTFLYKYRKDFSIIRSIGASGRQCFKIVFVQSTFINIIGCVLGFITAYIFNSKIINLIKPLFNFEIEIYNFNLLESIVITLITAIIIEVMMLIPAYKSSKILPLKIKEENEGLYIKKGSNIGTYIIYFIGFCIYCYGVVFKSNSESATIYALVASVFFVMGTVIYVMNNIQFILNKLLLPVKKVGGVYSFIAIKNMIPQVKRYSAIIIFISVLFMVITFSTSIFNIIEKNGIEYTKSDNPGDITVTSVLKWDSNLNYSIMEDFKKLDKNSSVSFINNSTAFVTDLSDDLTSVGVMDIKPFIENNILKVDNNINLNDKVVITEEFAKKNNLEIGNKITLASREYGESIEDKIDYPIGEFIVIGHMNKLPNNGAEIVIDFTSKASQRIIEELEKNDINKFERLIVFTENPRNYAEKLETLKGKYPELKWSITEDLLEENRQYLFQRWAVLIISMGAILFIVVLGAINSLMNDINNRRSEYAILRVLELKPKNVIQIIATQVLTYITLGLIIGVISGEIISIIIMSSEGIFSLGFNGKIILTFSTLIYILVFSIILPFAIKISRKNIAKELKSEV
ncbi:FtsX-like permease family protein [Clostridium sp. DSM 100503]|uniref:ABC transporter permease n=1 Tax=Clostridium sp. DSM 100503 TaxID=2963282 RepID=UPI00214A6B91|nr:FtsX-like permease family protein [Clostridium sp. DSM 100503]MCR1951539.1 FtsX-like permease family protein [Clostridium sp. DSM 100503]